MFSLMSVRLTQIQANVTSVGNMYTYMKGNNKLHPWDQGDLPSRPLSAYKVLADSYLKDTNLLLLLIVMLLLKKKMRISSQGTATDKERRTHACTHLVKFSQCQRSPHAGQSWTHLQIYVHETMSIERGRDKERQRRQKSYATRHILFTNRPGRQPRAIQQNNISAAVQYFKGLRLSEIFVGRQHKETDLQWHITD